MFTGLIEATGKVAGFHRQGNSGTLRIDTTLPCDQIAIGDSVAVNGACLTVTEKGTSSLTFDVSPETISGTTIGSFSSGRLVNLERALRFGDRLGGHLVTGHIDGIGVLCRVQTVAGGNRVLDFTLPPPQLRYLIPKGSVAIDGISLTVNTVTETGFSVNIIPHTLQHTTLAGAAGGQAVNIETDIIGKYVERMIKPWNTSGGLTMKTLAENGFL